MDNLEYDVELDLEEETGGVELEVSGGAGTTGGIDEETVKALIKEETKDLQPKKDENLETQSKEIVGAINELKAGVDEGGGTIDIIDIGNSYEEVEIVQHDTLSNTIKAKLPKMTGEQFKQAWEETLKGEKRVIFKWVEQVFTELTARYLSVVETCVFDNAEYPDRYYNLYVRGRFEQGDFVIRYCSDKDFTNVIIGEYWRNLTNIDRQVIVGKIDSNFSELYDRISMTYETIYRVNDEVWGGIATNTGRISEAWGSISSNTTRIQKLEDKSIAFVSCAGDFKDGYGTLTKRQITDILYYFNTMKTTVVLQDVKEVGTSYGAVNSVTLEDNAVSVVVLIYDPLNPVMLTYKVSMAQAETVVVYPSAYYLQKKLRFDGRYNAETNPVATVQYINNLPDKLTLTDEEQAKWRAMMGIKPSYTHNITFRVAVDDGFIIYKIAFKHIYADVIDPAALQYLLSLNDYYGTVGDLFISYMPCTGVAYKESTGDVIYTNIFGLFIADGDIVFMKVASATKYEEVQLPSDDWVSDEVTEEVVNY